MTELNLLSTEELLYLKYMMLKDSYNYSNNYIVFDFYMVV